MICRPEASVRIKIYCTYLQVRLDELRAGEGAGFEGGVDLGDGGLDEGEGGALLRGAGVEQLGDADLRGEGAMLRVRVTRDEQR